jgi:pimeloyl-ACP methyl ester carboxylesterase
MIVAEPRQATPAHEVLPGVFIRPQIAETQAGPIEYDWTEGTGPTVLSIHGGLGGCDQGRIMAAWIDPAAYRILSPSRPGYLGTPLDIGRTMEQQADALAALLDKLGIDKVIVFGASAGGPPAYWFAMRHRDRTAALVVVSGVSGFYDMPETAGPVMQAIFLSDLGQRLVQKLGEWSPRVVLQNVFQAEAYFTKAQRKQQIDFVMADEQRLAFIKAFLTTMSPYRLRKAGTENDLEQYRSYHHLPLDEIRSPSLIIHGTHDADVKFSDGVYAYEHIRGARRFWIEEGSHLGFWISPNAAHAQKVAREFMERYGRS